MVPLLPWVVSDSGAMGRHSIWLKKTVALVRSLEDTIGPESASGFIATVGRELVSGLPVIGENAACTPCHAPLDVPQKVDQKGAIESFSTGVSVSCTCTWSIVNKHPCTGAIKIHTTCQFCMRTSSICNVHEPIAWGSETRLGIYLGTATCCGHVPL